MFFSLHRKPLICCVEKQLLGEHMTAILQKGKCGWKAFCCVRCFNSVEILDFLWSCVIFVMIVIFCPKEQFCETQMFHLPEYHTLSNFSAKCIWLFFF